MAKSPPPTCVICGAVIPYTTGRKPTRCVDHLTPKQRNQRKRQMPQSAARLEEESAVDAMMRRAYEASQAELMAIGLRFTDDPRLGAQVAGLDPDAIDLEGLAKLARRDHEGLIKGKIESTGVLLRQAIDLAAVHLRVKVASMPVGQLSAAMKQLAQVLEVVQGGMDPVYGTITYVFPGDPELDPDAP